MEIKSPRPVCNQLHHTEHCFLSERIYKVTLEIKVAIEKVAFELRDFIHYVGQYMPVVCSLRPYWTLQRASRRFLNSNRHGLMRRGTWLLTPNTPVARRENNLLTKTDQT